MAANSQQPAGRVLIFAGNGKGKTAAALGTALRAAGHGLRVLVVQFIKAMECGEHVAAARFGKLLEIRCAGTGFLPERDCDIPPAAQAAAAKALATASEELRSGNYDLVVLDEVLYAVRRGLLSPDAVRRAVEGRMPGVHVILTGDGPWEGLKEIADTVTQMNCVKHAFADGQGPVKGIEY